jgi:hypothetical protein
MNRKTLLYTTTALLALASAPAWARNDSAGEGQQHNSAGVGTHAPWGGGGGVQYSIPAGQREPSRQPTGSVAGTTAVGICGCH